MAQSVVRLRMVWQNKVKKEEAPWQQTNQTINQKNYFPAGSSNPVSDDSTECYNAYAGGSGIPIFIVVVVANSKSVCFQTMDCHGFDSFYSSAGHHAADPWKA